MLIICYVSCGEGVPKLTLWTFAKFQVYWIVLVIGMPILSVIPSNTLILKYFILRSQEQAIRAWIELKVHPQEAVS